MAEEIGFENGRNSNFQGFVTLTLTLDPAIRHTVVHHSSTSTYIPNFIEIEETFCRRTDGHFPPLIPSSRTAGSNTLNYRKSAKNTMSLWRKEFVEKIGLKSGVKSEGVIDGASSGDDDELVQAILHGESCAATESAH